MGEYPPHSTGVPESSGSPPLGWSQDQLVRLEYEWRRLGRAYAYHPHVRIISMRGDPPDEYEIEYRVRTLRVSENGELEYTESAAVRISLPPSFPYAAPATRPSAALFHPNISYEAIHLSSWKPTQTLAELVSSLGELLAWRWYDPGSVVNPAAMEWLEASSARGELPVDAAADFSPDAGGEPLSRIAQHGPATLQQIRRHLENTCAALLDPAAAPAAPQVRDLSRRVRFALNLFMDDELPPALQHDASELDEWARELPASLPAWDHLRQQRAGAQALRNACSALSLARNPLESLLKMLEELAPPAIPHTASPALAVIPDLPTLHRVWLKLPALVREAQAQRQNIQHRLAELDDPAPEPALREDSVLQRRIASELQQQAADVQAVSQLVSELLAAIRPTLENAAVQAEALTQIVGWREYLDLLKAARELEQKLAMWGSTGVHAYYIEHESGRFGPFQFEQAVELGSRHLAVRSAGGNRIDVIDAHTTQVLARAEAGPATIQSASPGATVTFRPTERCEDLAVQIDYLIRQTADSLARLTAWSRNASSWCGGLLAVLGRPESRQVLHAELRGASQRWQWILEDLHKLALLKARIETTNLVRRLLEAIPRLQRELAGHRQRLGRCNAELGAILARCSRDLETDQLVIPPRLTEPYYQQIELRDTQQREIARIEQVLRDLGAQLVGRLGASENFGSADVPTFQGLRAISPELLDAITQMNDALLDEQLTHLETLLGIRLRTPASVAALAQQPESP